MTSIPTLIGLIGRKGSGKDTVASVLLTHGYQNVKFAGALKEMIRSVLAYQGADAETIERMIEGDLKEVATEYLAGRSPRYAMQTVGTDWGRKLMNEDLWVGVTINKAVAHPTVITDVRFPNERAAIEQAGGVCFGITADWISAVEGEHESEALIDKMIASLPAGRRLINRRAEGDNLPLAVMELRTRFLNQLHSA